LLLWVGTWVLYCYNYYLVLLLKGWKDDLYGWADFAFEQNVILIARCQNEMELQTQRNKYVKQNAQMPWWPG